MNGNAIELTKARAAEKILESCIGRHGIWAGNGRYAGQCWTRDMALASAPLLMEEERFSDVRRHLETLSRQQHVSGKIPILYLDGVRGTIRFLLDKTRKSIRENKMSFMLGRFREGELWNLTPGTRDSEILYLLAMLEYGTHDPAFLTRHGEQVVLAFRHVHAYLMEDGLLTGADWRDTMEKELRTQPLLTNNSILFRVYQLAGLTDRAEALRTRILDTHFANGEVIDYPGNDRFDPLGASLAVLHGVVVGEKYRARIVEHMRQVDSPTGVTIRCRHNPMNDVEDAMIKRTNGVVSWPFVVGFTVLALLEMGERAFAEEQFAKMVAHDGFREYYDPSDAAGYGEINQLWSAALYLRAYHAINEMRESLAFE